MDEHDNGQRCMHIVGSQRPVQVQVQAVFVAGERRQRQQAVLLYAVLLRYGSVANPVPVVWGFGVL